MVRRRYIFAFMMAVMSVSTLLIAGDAENAEEEALHIRRIAQFWQDEEYPFVKQEIARFRKEYPDSSFLEWFSGMMGDVAMAEERYEEALAEYANLESSEFQEKVFANKLYALFVLKRYEEVLEVATEALPDEEVALFYSGKALFQQGKYREAESFFRKLVTTQYKDRALEGLAEVFRYTGQASRAAGIYLRLAEECEGNEGDKRSKREDYLYYAASLQAQEEPEEGLATFRRMEKASSEKSEEAAWRELLLLMDLKRYEEVIERSEQIVGYLSSDKKSLFAFFLGRAYFLSDRYEESVKAILPFISAGEAYPDYHQAALLTGLAAAGQAHQVERVEEWFAIFESLYFREPEMGKAIFLKAMAYKGVGDKERTLQDLDRIVEAFPTFSELDDVLFERNVLLYEVGRIAESREDFLEFVERYPRSPYTGKAYQFVVGASIKLFDRVEGEQKREELAQQLADDIEMVFSKEGVIEEDQKPRYLLRLAKTFYQLKHYEKAQDVLSRYFDEYPSHEGLDQGHFLFALCEYEESENYANFVEHGERVLELNPAFEHRVQLRRNLFSAYLQLAREVDLESEEKQRLFDLAADHLYEAFSETDEPIPSENLLWLASHYCDRSEEGNRSNFCASRAVEVFTEVFGEEGPVLTQENLHTEKQILSWAKILGKLDRSEEQMRLLEYLRQMQEKQPDWAWNSVDGTLFTLAQCYACCGEKEKALEGYERLIKSRYRRTSSLIAPARLQWARLAFDRLSSEDRVLGNRRVTTILNMLKNLQVRRQVEQEPLHLEAAIDYAEMQAMMRSSEERVEALLKFFVDLKMDYSQREDFSAKDYHSRREELPEKNRIYQAHMMFIDAQISYLKYLSDVRRGEVYEGDRRQEAAKTILSTLLEGKFAVSRYLINQARLGLQAIEAGTLVLDIEESRWGRGFE